ncbi:MAG: 3-hydroxyacyl-ACP dehydratase FabZ [Deltaproteobacteria bacterium]|nr:3-hydroxyacyl-ACP dehydratase FabZ [Deltaproteobacteria bacterium]MBW2150845.1 3-hydroxyacyl-ACP dehydratase FabZ [Deltaproteobacteria bacterium]
MDTSFDILRIMEFLPHRYPFILVDRVLSIEPGKKVIALKNVTINEPFFQGHFPGAPIMPGVLIIEALGQAGGILAFLSQSKKKPGSLIYFTGIDKVRFRKPVVPGDQLILELEMLKLRATVVKMAGRAMVDEKLVAEAELMASIGVKS